MARKAPLYINLKDTDGRIKTFEGWPVDFLDPKKLAIAGLYYTKQNDKVRCAYCLLGMEGWVPGDDPAKDHIRLSPTCPFLDPMSLEHFQNQNETLTFGQFEVFGNLANLEIYFNAIPPAYEHFKTHQSRLKSFLTWPKSMKIKPEILASAGFFYTGSGDETVCFYCGGGMREWEEDDDPIVEHAKHFKKCSYIAALRGIHHDKPEDAICDELGAMSLNNDKAKKCEENPSQALLCKICCKEELSIVFLPCGHLFTCVNCAFSLDKCGICRKFVTGYLRVFLS